ncbi:MAG: hypothetical protein ABI906_11855 [Pseudomonadota bacterium]
MSLKSTQRFLALAVLTALAPGMASAASQNVDDLIARHVAARGGMAALKAIKTLKMTGTMRPAGFDAELTYVETIARPGSVRIDATLQGLTIVQAYDGAGGWQIQPFQGRKDAEAVSTDDAKSLEEEADFEGGLIDYKAKGAKVESLGDIDVDGAPTHALRVTLKNGDQQTYYLDPDALLTVRIVTRQLVRGAEVLTQTDFGDYEKVDGVYFPFEVATGPKGETQQQKITYAKAEANIATPPALFARPAGPAATPGAGPPVAAAPAPHSPVPPAKGSPAQQEEAKPPKPPAAP